MQIDSRMCDNNVARAYLSKKIENSSKASVTDLFDLWIHNLCLVWLVSRLFFVS
jgi:hypothetical protein